MKGLLIKDIGTLARQFRYFLLMLVIFVLMPGYSMTAFAVCYSAMMPITALAYDERSKWDKLAAMLPYSSADIVLSKYILGFLCMAASALLSIMGKMGYDIYTNTPFRPEIFVDLLPIICAGVLLQAINLPLMFAIGVEKGRILFIALTAACVSGYIVIADRAPDALRMEMPALLALIAAAVIAAAVSAAVSVWLYNRREK